MCHRLKYKKLASKSRPQIKLLGALNYVPLFVHIMVPLLTFHTVLHFLTLFMALLVKIINPKFCFGVSVAVGCFPVLFSLLNAQLYKSTTLKEAKYKWNHQNFTSLGRLGRYFEECLCCS